MKKNILLITIFIFIILLTLAVYGYYRLFVVSTLPPTTEKQPEVVLVGSQEFSSFGINSLYALGKYLYMAEEKGINILDISNPSNPTTIGFYMVHRAGSRFGGSWEAPKDIYVLDDHIYIATPSGLEIANISNPQKPEFTGYFGTFEEFGATANKVLAVDNYFFLGTTNGLLILDISNPTKPVLVGRYDSNLSIDNIFVISKDYLYLTGNIKNVAQDKDYLYLVDVSDKSNPKLAKKYSEGFPLPTSIYFVDNIAYILSIFPKYGLSVFDLSDPEDPVLIGEYEKEISYIKLYILDRYLRKTSGESLLNIDISDLGKYLSIEGLPKSLGNFYAHGNYIYSVGSAPDKYATSRLQIFEIK